MGLSPWHLSRTFKDSEAAALLAGYENVIPGTASWIDVDTRLIGEWVDRMIDAAHRRELTLLDIFATTVEPGSTVDSKLYGVPVDRSVSMEQMAQEKLIHVTFKIERDELYRWLRASGIEHEAMPEALRVMPSKEESVNQTQEQAMEGEELRALEALGLLVETMAKQSRKYQVGEAGRPNCAQIAEAMSQQAGDVYGMKPRTLKGRLSEALIAWQEKCK